MTGEQIVFRGIKCPPTEEQGVVALFAVLLPDLDFEIEHIGTAFPDCIAWRGAAEKRQRAAIEFEFRSSGFDHDPKGCDLVVCWEVDAALPDLEVIELRAVLEDLTGHTFGAALAPTVEELAERRNLPAELRDLYSRIDDQLLSRGSIHRKVTGWYVHYRSGKHLLAYLSSYPDYLQLDLFTGGAPLPGAGESKSPNFKPVRIRHSADLPAVFGAIRESYGRLEEAVSRGEPTGYYGTRASRAR
jgi:hypothetical protein